MKRILYIVPDHIERFGNGVKKKIEMQRQVLEGNRNKVEIYEVNKSMNFFRRIFSIVTPFGDSGKDYNSIKQYIDFYDVLYIRYPKSTFGFIELLKYAHKKGKKILIEIPTFPYDMEGREKGIREILVNIDKYKDEYFRKYLEKYVNRIITFSNDSMIFNIPTIRISNCVDLNKIKVKKTVNHEGINLIAVANFNFWHGYERLIKGIKTYYENGGKRMIRFYIVGDGKTISTYKKYVSDFNLDQHVFFTGNLTGEALDHIYNLADIGIDALARHRTGVTYNSSIKGKEYLAKGLPIVSGVKTELDFDENFRYYMRVPANESEINIQMVLEFYSTIYGSNCENKKNVIKDIRNYAEKEYIPEKCFVNVKNYIEG